MNDAEAFEIVPAVGATLRWRGFGRPGDLDLDLRAGDRPALVTRVLARCLAEPVEEAEEAAWRLTLAARIGGLAAIVAQTFGAEALAVALRCPGCGEGFEIELPLSELVDLARAAEREPVLELHGDAQPRLALRRPTGADLRQWHERAYASRREAEAGILAALRLPDDRSDAAADEAALARAAELLEAQDPLPAFRASCACPACGREDDHALDLEALLLVRLAQRQQALTLEIHRLAGRYGWSETEILAIPPRRRADYLRLMDRESGWP